MGSLARVGCCAPTQCFSSTIAARAVIVGPRAGLVNGEDHVDVVSAESLDDCGQA